MQWTVYLKIAAFIFDVTSIVIQTKLSRCLMLDPCMMLQIMIIENGAYGKRQVKICETLKIPFTHLQIPENEMACPIKARDALRYMTYILLKLATHWAIYCCNLTLKDVIGASQNVY